MTARRIVLEAGADLEGFRSAVRVLAAANIAPADVVWSAGNNDDLFGEEATDDGPSPEFALPRDAVEIIKTVVCHRDDERFALLYQLIWRLRHGERQLMAVHSDPLVHRLTLMAKAVRHELHRMHAFVRFRRTGEGADERFVAFFDPEHYILEAAAEFFVDRFPAFAWSILTPLGSLHWDKRALTFGPAAPREAAPDADAFESVWRGYYESTFNPARLNEGLMRQHMPRRYWANMPETAAIPGLIQQSSSRVKAMIESEAKMSAKRRPDKAIAAMSDTEPKTLAELNAIIETSEPFVHGATRAVLGEGPVGAPIAFVGEQPGDVEDQQRRPFVGPAGQLLMRAMEEAGIERGACYLTNAVKHFKFQQRGKRRLHQSPTAGEIKHYRWWLMKEIELVAPRVVVALGGSAVLALSGKSMPVTRFRGPAQFGARQGFITVHPSYLLRIPDIAAKGVAYDAFVSDLRAVANIIA